MKKTRAWQVWWENDPDAQKFKNLSVTMCCHGVNIPQLTRESYLAGVAMRPYIDNHKKQTKLLKRCENYIRWLLRGSSTKKSKQLLYDLKIAQTKG